MARVFTGLLLTLVLTVLVLPLAVYAGPPVLAALRHEQPARQVVVPSYQQSPVRLASGGDEFPVPAGSEAPAPDTRVLAALLDAELAVDGSGKFSGAVQDALTGEVLYDLDGDVPVTPASSLKLLTAAAALSDLGADTRFETGVHAGTAPGTIILKGGGDVLLTAGESDDDAIVGHAGLQTLADETAAALAERGTSGTVSIRLDDTLFTGASLSPAWSREDVAAGEMAALYPLAINSAWAAEGVSSGPRAGDAALAAASAFAAALETSAAGYGFTVDPVIERGAAAEGADRLASVVSAPVADQVQQMLLSSDNYLAEALARMSAQATGREATFEGGTAAVLSAVSRLGVDTGGLVLADVSGLGGGTEISARQLAATVQAALTSTKNDVRALPYSLPVAGLSGTLSSRLTGTTGTGGTDGAGPSPAGVVRGKTGSLFAVTSLSGFVTDADGRLLSFAFVANGLEGNTAQARAAVDAAATVLAGCGCR
ncbi:D-alanyl-D-alanine carboxypeptidase/D-alanyl-D-alanine-endopeptidase [Arthrobacter sp. zg-Y820]|uniref:D-alanyl-D-alanine carboxypeptidase/D-alanyl-D-alanine endopeptidase n=1 Tax=Arthrobacter sp. zg-Y820 TaxID=2894192 RepID=UPI0024E040B7|nr:D-alanyl-D-alanine carboxypeptidase/D-alanyl-D-alanine-endopeptidase [Arthrobacter sp. zg-Y820]WIB09598.1 D-alanyl-D-alanine carboxypeptidase/D-alanyl-D-alanine-endopeptidase [Arthrobacter sp. zg-Y820]